MLEYDSYVVIEGIRTDLTESEKQDILLTLESDTHSRVALDKTYWTFGEGLRTHSQKETGAPSDTENYLSGCYFQNQRVAQLYERLFKLAMLSRTYKGSINAFNYNFNAEELYYSIELVRGSDSGKIVWSIQPSISRSLNPLSLLFNEERLALAFYIEHKDIFDAIEEEVNHEDWNPGSNGGGI